MHSADLVDLAALVATHTPSFLRLTKMLPQCELERYWTASKCRQDRWQLALLDLKDSRARLVGATGGLHRFAWGVFEEIFTGEILTRIWTGVLAAFDVQHGTDHAQPVAQSVLAGHLEVRCRTLSLLSTARELPLADLVELNRLRRLCERWTDLLLAEMAHGLDLSGLAHETERMLDFAADVPRRTRGAYAETRRSLVRTSLRAAFVRPATLPAPNGDLNRQIAAGVLGCFQPELFDGAGVLHSAWVARLMAAADDAETMLEDYLAMASVAVRDKPGRRGLPRF
ncbi:MAG: hypothetical protein WD894_09665 [Pirellulales bacterium]